MRENIHVNLIIIALHEGRLCDTVINNRTWVDGYQNVPFNYLPITT